VEVGKKIGTPSKLEIARSAISADERLLVTGASGWLGRSALALFSGCGIQVMALSSRNFVISIDDHEIEVQKYDIDSVRSFRPTLVIDCAFLTRDRITETGVDIFLETNKELIRRAQELAGLESVRKFIGVSSGAAKPYLDLKTRSYLDDPYGALKAEYEVRLTQGSEDISRKVVVCRPFSLSGRFVINRSSYALFEIIDQAKNTGTVFLKSSNLVFRRYTDAEEFLALCIASSPGGRPLESGGELIELGNLAEKVIDVLNLSSTVEREENSGPPDIYYSDGSSFDLACAQAGFTPSSLSEQIRNSSNS
jgi:nucleoside-diphosphate-sugar epimerase